MSTTDMMTTPTQATPRDETERVPFSRLLVVEIRKLTDTRAGMWLLIAIAAITAVVVTIMLFTANAADLTFANFVLATSVPQAILLPILGILAVTSEWSQRTGLVTFTLEPRRSRVAAAKLVAAALLGVAAVGVAFGTAALANIVGTTFMDGNGSWHMTGSVVGGALLLQVLGVVQGVAFGMAILSSAAAIVAFLVLPTAWTVLGSMVSWLHDAAGWLDLGTTSGPLLEGSMHGEQWARLGTSTALWVLLPLAFGLYRLVHREVK